MRAVNQLFAYFLTALLLLQTLGPELLVVNYELNKADITAEFCVNKAKPLLHCNGQCHLAQQLRKAEAPDKKAPASLIRAKFEVLPAALRLALRAPRRWPAVAGCYAARPDARYADAPASGVFRPPLARRG